MLVIMDNFNSIEHFAVNSTVNYFISLIRN